jgi:hypothetical protein
LPQGSTGPRQLEPVAEVGIKLAAQVLVGDVVAGQAGGAVLHVPGDLVQQLQLVLARPVGRRG